MTIIPLQVTQPSGMGDRYIWFRFTLIWQSHRQTDREIFSINGCGLLNFAYLPTDERYMFVYFPSPGWKLLTVNNNYARSQT